MYKMPAEVNYALLREKLPETQHEEPYGTVALARQAIEAFAQADDIIVLVNHGYVCVGPSLEAVIERLVATHLRLLA